MSKARDGPQLLRWDKQSDHDKAVWMYFDQQVASNIVREALKDKSLTLANLYHVLSMARLKCEWIKSKSPTSQQEIEEYVKMNPPMMTYMHCAGGGFGCFQLGGSRETNIDEGWGELVGELYKKRIGRVTEKRHVGLSEMMSTYQEGITLLHPVAAVFDRLEMEFRKLVETTQFFEFVQIAARLTYELANYPPIGRGNLAVTSWIINKLFQQKFHSFRPILPLHFDWMAFYETQEQYVTFFIIAGIARYVRDLPTVYEKHKEFFDSLWDVLTENPNEEENVAAREQAWLLLKKIIAESAADDLHLRQAASWNLTFRKPSSRVLALVKKIEKNELENLDEDYLETLLELNNDLSEAHIAAFGKPEELEFNQIWIDLERLRMIPESRLYLFAKYAGLEVTNKSSIVKPDELRRNFNFYSMVGQGVLTQEATGRLAQLDRYWKENQYETPLKLAIMHGGLSLTDALIFSDQQLDLVSSEPALLLYQLNRFIRATHLVSASKVHMQNTLLQLVAKHLLQDEISDIPSDEVREVLLTPLTVELYRMRNIKLSSLLSGDIGEFYQKMFELYLTNYFNEPSIKILDVKNAVENLNYLFHLINRLRKNHFHTENPREFLEKRAIKASALMQLSRNEIATIIGYPISPSMFTVPKTQEDYEAAVRKLQELTEKSMLEQQTLTQTKR